MPFIQQIVNKTIQFKIRILKTMTQDVNIFNLDIICFKNLEIEDFKTQEHGPCMLKSSIRIVWDLKTFKSKFNIQGAHDSWMLKSSI